MRELSIPIDFFKALDESPAIFRLLWVQWLKNPERLISPTFPDRVSYNNVPRETIRDCYKMGMRFFGEGFNFSDAEQRAERLAASMPESDESSEDDNKAISEIIQHLNRVTGSKYKLNSKSTTKLIRSRLREGYSVDDIKGVIDKKARQWLNTKWASFLRPITLFNNTKFENYYNELEFTERQQQGNADKVRDAVAEAKARIAD